MSTENNTHRVVVYGSLLKGLHNHSVIGSHIESGNAKYIGNQVVEIPFKMIDLGSFPGIIPNSEDERDNKIFVEIYELNDEANRSVECLEGYNEEDPDKGFYKKAEVGTNHGMASIYVLNSSYSIFNEAEVPMEEGIVNWRNYVIERNQKSYDYE